MDKEKYYSFEFVKKTQFCDVHYIIKQTKIPMMKKLLMLICLFAFVIEAEAQVYPFYEDFESFGNNFPQITTGGYSSDMYAYPRGLNGSKGAQAQMTQFNKVDSLVTPSIGPLTATSQVSFYFRVVEYIGSTAVGHTLSGSSSVQVQAGAFGTYQTIHTITSANQNSGTNFRKVTVAAGGFSGISGNLKFRALHPTNTGDWFLHLDSIVVRDTTAGSCNVVIDETLTNVSCLSESDGEIALTVSGCAGPYSFLWNDNATTQNRTGLAAGTYGVTVNASGITASGSYTITEPNAININAISTNESCFGACDGLFEGSPTGGTAPYNYAPLTDLCEGNYTLIVSDANGCTASASTTITSPAELTSVGSSTPTANNDGTATVTVNGGTPPYEYLWEGFLSQDSSTLVGVSAGEYEVTIIDDNGCELTDTVIVEAIIGIATKNVNNISIQIMPNPTNNLVTIKGSENTSLRVMNILGEIIQQFDVTPSMIEVGEFPKGNYILLFENDKGSSKKRLTIY